MLTELVRLFMLPAALLPCLTAAASLLPIAAAVFVKVGVQAEENGLRLSRHGDRSRGEGRHGQDGIDHCCRF